MNPLRTTLTKARLPTRSTTLLATGSILGATRMNVAKAPMMQNRFYSAEAKKGSSGSGLKFLSKLYNNEFFSSEFNFNLHNM